MGKLKLPLVVKSESTLMFPVMFFGASLLVLVFNVAIQNLNNSHLMICALLALMGCLFLWAAMIARRREVRLDPCAGLVSISTVSLFFKPRLRSYPLDQFRSVRSCLTPGSRTINYVELVTKLGGEALEVAYFEPSSSASSFWSLLPPLGENKAAGALRQTIASHFQLVDDGFLGGRWEGAGLKDF